MIKRSLLILGLAPFLMASQCHKEDGRIVISDACETIYRLLYKDPENPNALGKFTLTDDEIDHLRPINQTKVANLKTWFKGSCPEQYARTVGGQKK